MKRSILLVAGLSLAILLAACGTAGTPAATTTAASNTATAAVSFSHDIQPILSSNCVSCHGPTVTSYSTLVGDANTGGVVIAGDAANSLLLQMVASGQMPRGGPKLAPAQVQLIQDWINAGAPNN
jgi:mono/diheme cytochrome c family protein